MMRSVPCLALVLGLARAACAQDAPVADLADGRSGTVRFESVTPSGYFQLARGQATNRTVIWGTLRLASATDRTPAMVISHGSGGISQEREGGWAERLAAIGVASFIVDSFGPRNIRSTATDQAQLSTAANVADALAALRLLATHPRIDPERIGVIGFSKGGQVALYTALEPYRRAVIADARRFAAHVALYPYCSDWQVSRNLTGAPLLFLLGGRDNYTPAQPCRDYADWFKAHGADAAVVVYPNAYHDFDLAQSPVFARDVVTGRDCDMAYDLDHFTIASRKSGEDITRTAQDYARRCLTRGATLGGDAEARQRAPEDVQSFLKRVFRL